MKIKTRHEILDDILSEAKKHPLGWKAVFGRDEQLLSDDYYVFNPHIGVYAIKEYQKNPFEIKGLGGKISRNVNDEIEEILHKNTGEFGILQGDIRRIIRNIEAGVQPQVIFEAAIKGKEDMGLRMPLKGSASTSRESFNQLRDIVFNRQKKLDAKFERMSSSDGIYTSYG